MNASTVHRIISLIPERVARARSGALFTMIGARRHPERIAYLSSYLQWLSPLNPVSRDDQKLLGLLLANGRPVHAGDVEDEADAAPSDMESALEVLEPEADAQDEADDEPDDLDIPVALLDDEPVEDEQHDRNVEIVELVLRLVLRVALGRGIGLVFDVSRMHRPAVRQKQAEQLLVVPGNRVEGTQPLQVPGEVGDPLRMAAGAGRREKRSAPRVRHALRDQRNDAVDGRCVHVGLALYVGASVVHLTAFS